MSKLTPDQERTLRDLYAYHEVEATRARFKGNPTWPANKQIRERVAYHQAVVDALRAAMGCAGLMLWETGDPEGDADVA